MDLDLLRCHHDDFLNDVKSRPRISVEEDDQSDQIVNEMYSRLGNGIQFIQVTEDEVMDTLNERASAYRAEHVSVDEVVEEMNARILPCPLVIQVTADKFFVSWSHGVELMRNPKMKNLLGQLIRMNLSSQLLPDHPLIITVPLAIRLNEDYKLIVKTNRLTVTLTEPK